MSQKLLYLQLQKSASRFRGGDWRKRSRHSELRETSRRTNGMLEEFFAQKKMEVESQASLSAEAQASVAEHLEAVVLRVEGQTRIRPVLDSSRRIKELGLQ